MPLPVIAGVLASCAPQSAAQLTVFDPLNYQENLLSAARALEQINNQVRQLQNQAQMLAAHGPEPAAAGVDDRHRTCNARSPTSRPSCAPAKASPCDCRRHQSGYEQLFPRQVSAALSADDVLRNAKSRWDEEYAGLKRAALLQGQIADSVDADARLLGDAMARSRDAAGALKPPRPATSSPALNVKQSLQLQSLLAAQHRAETLAPSPRSRHRG